MKFRKLKRLQPFKRKVHLPSGTWTYRVTDSVVQVRTPNCTITHRIPLPDVCGMNWCEIERGVWKGWFGIYPHQVKKYIEQKLCQAIPTTSSAKPCAKTAARLFPYYRTLAPRFGADRVKSNSV